MYWYVCAGSVEQYCGQEVNWRDSVIVFAASPEDALFKVMKFHLGRLGRRGAEYNGKAIEVIV